MSTRTYEIVTESDTYRIDIPDDWKVTFGPVAVGGGKRGYSDMSGGSMALRLYENSDKQRAIFTGVRSFRDLSIPVKRLNKTRKEKLDAESSRKGRKSTEQVDISEAWEDLP